MSVASHCVRFISNSNILAKIICDKRATPDNHNTFFCEFELSRFQNVRLKGFDSLGSRLYSLVVNRGFAARPKNCVVSSRATHNNHKVNCTLLTY